MKLFVSRFVRRPAIWILLVLGLAVLCGLAVGRCGTPPPILPAPVTVAPTITQVAEITPLPATHIPTRTLTPIPPTLFILPATETPTWTATFTRTFTATPTATFSPTATATPSLSPVPTVAATITPTSPLLPHTGASKAELTRIAETATVTATTQPTGTPSATPVPEIEPLPPCAVKWKVVYYHWENGEWTMKLRCPLEGTPVTSGAGL